MSKRYAVLAAAVAAATVTCALFASASAQAVTVDLVGNNNSNHSLVGIWGWAPGEQNDITIKPSDTLLPASDAVDAAHFPWLPVSVVVTDRTTPLQVGIGTCFQLDAHSVQCTTYRGIDSVHAELGEAGSSFELIPGRNGYKAPLIYDLNTRDGNDRVTIPTARGINALWTSGGNDTIDVNDASGVWGDLIKAGPGDDDVKLRGKGWGNVDCGDGIDTALLESPELSPQNCETVTP